MNTIKLPSLLLFNCFLIIATGFFACTKEEEEPVRDIKIGVLLGFSGIGSQNAIETKAALDIALQDIDDYLQRTNLKVSVELLYKDTESDTAVAKLKAQNLIDQGVRLIIGPYTSAEAMAVKQLADEQDVLLVSHSAVSTALALPNDNFLRFVPSDHYQAEALNAMLTRDGIEAMVAVVRNDIWSNPLIDAVSDLFLADGGNIVSELAFEPGTDDFAGLATEITGALNAGAALYGEDKTALYMISFADGTNILEALSDAGATTEHKVYGASAYARDATLTASADAAAFALQTGLKVPVFGFDEMASHIYKDIQERIKKETGETANIYALAAYDILLTTFLTKITQDPGAPFSAFKSHFIDTAASYYGATGHTKLDENGDRMLVFYDFWSIAETNAGTYSWEIVAKYDTSSGMLTFY